jgi:biopolymer transport protein ExbB/TolQ
VNTAILRRSTFLQRHRPIIAGLGLIVGLVTVTILYLTLPDGAAKILIDRGGVSFPFSVQNVMWAVFFVALGELAVRFVVGRAEFEVLAARFLPEDERTILQAEDLSPIYKDVKNRADGSDCFLPRLIQRSILQFQSSRSIGQANTLLNSSMEMFLHEVDLRYNMLRYITWLIPSLGFIGTVVGIGHALSYAGEPGRFQQPTLLSEVTRRLAISFDGTFLALVMAALLVFLMNILQSREEHALNQAGQYCLDNLINRLYVTPSA